jgi:hypothetical protein
MGIGDFFSNIITNFKNGIDGLSSKFKGGGKTGGAAEFIRSHLLIAGCIAGAFFIIIVLLIILAVKPALKKPESGLRLQAETSFAPRIIPPEDFFLPYEPDFVPDVLLEREPKDGWSEEDARPYWTDPMEGNEAAWRRRIEEGVDGILERVP